MPRGWLKNQERTFGKKASRGGSSARKEKKKQASSINSDPEVKTHKSKSNIKHRGQNSVPTTSWNDRYAYFIQDEEECTNFFSEDEDEYTQNKENLPQECPICCEIRPLVSLLKSCKHPPSCQRCLREIYIHHAQEDISNYPLRCYHPSCNKPVRDTQLIHHNLVHSKKELQKHYRFTELQKAYANADTLKIVYCPECKFPKTVRKQNNFINCKQCGTNFMVQYKKDSHDLSTINAIEAMKRDKFGCNDGWANCPSCHIMISKGSGCDHMHCICGHDFSWFDAQNARTQHHVNKLVVAETLRSIESNDIVNKLSLSEAS